VAIENKRDREATKAARKAGTIHAPSWLSYAGHVYLRGPDASAMREKVFAKQRRCQICWAMPSDELSELDHVRGGTKVRRCWCWRQRLSDGTRCTNLQRVCGRFSSGNCHQKKHHREILWTKR